MIEVRDVSVRLDGNLIIDGVDLDVADREWVTVIGPNGAGKSTLLRAVGGLVSCAGEVRLGADRLAALKGRERARRIATVAQNVTQ